MSDKMTLGKTIVLPMALWVQIAEHADEENVKMHVIIRRALEKEFSGRFISRKDADCLESGLAQTNGEIERLQALLTKHGIEYGESEGVA